MHMSYNNSNISVDSDIERVLCNGHAEYLDLMNVLSALNYSWVDGSPCNCTFDPYVEQELTPDTQLLVTIAAYNNVSYSKIIDDSYISVNAFKCQRDFRVDTISKSDIADGMIVCLRDSRCYMYYELGDTLIRNTGCIDEFSKRYADDLTFSAPMTYSTSCPDIASGYNSAALDIVEVYKPGMLRSLDLALEILQGRATLLWKRPEEVFMTIADIEEKLGIKNLKIIES